MELKKEKAFIKKKIEESPSNHVIVQVSVRKLGDLHEEKWGGGVGA